MATGDRSIWFGLAVAGFLTAAGHAPAQAQEGQQALSADEVRSFFESMGEDVTQAVRSGDYETLLDWTESRIADEATFVMSQELYVGEERKAFSVTSLDKQDMVRFGHIMMGMMSRMPNDALQDYELTVEVVEVHPIGPNAATATTRFTESGKFAMAGGEAAGQSSAEPAQIEVTAECTHLLRRDEGSGDLMLGLSTCQARTNL